MTILVTGGAGYIGSHMVLELLRSQQRAIVIDDLSTGFHSVVPPNVPLVVGDVGDAQTVSRAIRDHGVTAIAHFAAKTVVPDSVADPLGYYLANTNKSRNLIETAVASGVKNFIFSSTAAVYGDVDSAPVSEDATPRPMSAYGRSKLITEWMLADTAHAHDFRYIALRYFNVAGADPAGNPANRRRAQPISSRSPCRRLCSSGRTWRCSAAITRPTTGPASATTSR